MKMLEKKTSGDRRKTNIPPFRIATAGGTFQAMHLGHRKYLELALRLAERAHIYVTSDDYAGALKEYPVAPFEVRCKEVQSFLSSIDANDRVIMHELASLEQLQEFVLVSALDVAVVEPQYLELFQKLNRLRSNRGMEEFCIVLKPRTKVDGFDVSSTSLQGPLKK